MATSNNNPNHEPHGPPPDRGPPDGEPRGDVTIRVNDKAISLRRGQHEVSEIKQLAGVPQAYELDQQVGDTLVSLQQDGKVLIKGGEVFVAYPATGTSS